MTYSSILNRILTAVLLLCCSYSSFGQISQKSQPNSFSLDNNQKAKFKDLETTILPVLDMKKIIEEDQKMPGTVRYAAPIEVDLDLNNSGQWTILDNGDRIWRIKLKSKGALGIYALYDNFYLPPGAALFMYDSKGGQVKGAYTAINNKATQRFMTGMVRGEDAIIEYFEPAAANQQGSLHLFKLMIAYHHDKMIPPETGFNNYSSTGFGDALDCHINVNCPQGDGWEDQARGTVRLNRVFEEGIGWCSGSLVNNTNEDEHPYVLSAFHCVTGYTPYFDLWRTDFHYQYEDCNSTGTEPEYNSILGLTVIAKGQDSDFSLLELSTAIPNYYNVYFNGWSRHATAVPTVGTIIHHPKGDVKKISKDLQSGLIHIGSIIWSDSVTTPPNTHFRALLDEGTVESGSSGSPFFDQNKRIVGQLHGGNTSCSVFVTYHGRFSVSWDDGDTPETRLMDWLDPAGTNPITLNGFNPEPVEAAYALSGNITTISDAPVSNVDIKLLINGGNAQEEGVTDALGDFNFTALAEDNSYALVPEKDGALTNGVTTFDIVLIQKHILDIELLNTPEQLIAADINNSGTITTFDIVNLRRVILTLDDAFQNNTSWRFYPDTIFHDNLNAILPDQNFKAIKIGDVNGTADPSM